MSSTVLPPLSAAGLPPDPIWRISVDQYHLMIEAGVFANNERIELLEGLLVEKMSKKPEHAASKRKTRAELERIVPAGWFVDTEDPITTSDSEPEPDVAVVRGKPDDFVKRHPAARDVGMLVEIADTSLGRDRGVKKRIFARANIPVYWIINLIDRQIEVYINPSGPADQPDYATPQIFRPGNAVPVLLDGAEIGKIDVNAILP